MRPSLLLNKGFYIPAGIVVTGNFSSDKEGGIEGTINGDVLVKAALIIEKKGIVNGDLHARDLIIKGRVSGNVYCEGRVCVLKDAVVGGNIFASESRVDRFSIVKGVISHLNQKRESPNNTGTVDDASGENLIPLIPEFIMPDEPPQTWF
ncbi:MAG: bactofilin family protein [Ginsengibacter sp.]